MMGKDRTRTLKVERELIFVLVRVLLDSSFRPQ